MIYVSSFYDNVDICILYGRCNQLVTVIGFFVKINKYNELVYNGPRLLAKGYRVETVLLI